MRLLLLLNQFIVVVVVVNVVVAVDVVVGPRIPTQSARSCKGYPSRAVNAERNTSIACALDCNQTELTIVCEVANFGAHLLKSPGALHCYVSWTAGGNS